MRLLDLDPRWLEKDGRRIGFTFLCPHCRKDRLTCFSEPTPFREQVKIMHAAMHSWLFAQRRMGEGLTGLLS